MITEEEQISMQRKKEMKKKKNTQNADFASLFVNASHRLTTTTEPQNKDKHHFCLLYRDCTVFVIQVVL